MASDAIKRQRRRKRIDTDGDPEFQVAPMVDVLLVLMLFFMAITSTEVLKKSRHVNLPDEKNAKPAEHDQHRNEIVVNVIWDPLKDVAHFSLNEQDYASANDMKGALAAAVARNPNAHVVVRADQDTQYTDISDVMDACASVGISTVQFAVLIGGRQHTVTTPTSSASTQ